MRADVAWRPDPATASETRLGRFLAATGEPDLEALQARAADDPALVLGRGRRRPGARLAAPARGPRMDISAGVEWAPWWGGGAFNHAAAAVDRRARLATPTGPRSSGRARTARSGRSTNARAARAPSTGRRPCSGPMACGAGDRVGILLPMLRRDRRRRPGSGQAAGHLHAHLLGLRRRAIASRPDRLRGVAAHHRRRLLPARHRRCALKATADAAVAMAPSVRRGARRPARWVDRRSWRRRSPGARRHGPRVATTGGTRRWPSPASSRSARRRRPIPRRPT